MKLLNLMRNKKPKPQPAHVTHAPPVDAAPAVVVEYFPGPGTAPTGPKTHSVSSSGSGSARDRSHSRTHPPAAAAGQRACRNNCGWTAFGTHPTCCAKCKDPGGPHSEDCPIKNTRTGRLCERGCGRAANAGYKTCSKDCRGPEEPFCKAVEESKAVPASSSHARPLCERGCGRHAFSGYKTCCRGCHGPGGPHSAGCQPPPTDSAAVPEQPRCKRGCGRPAFASFDTCCARCACPDGPHASDCARKAGLLSDDTAASAAAAAAAGLPRTADEVLEALRSKLAEWHRAGVTKKRAEVEEIIDKYAASASMSKEAVRMLWLQAARQARPVGAPVDKYIELARRHHGIEVEVIDLGGGSSKHQNSCMFLTCAAALVDRRNNGYDFPSGPLGLSLYQACPETNAMEPVEELIAQHRRTKQGTLGRIADTLRKAACEALTLEAAFFRPFFSPVREAGGDKKAFEVWIEKLRGDEEGDELVMLALARILGIAIQPVQQSGYRVPLMDPMGVFDKEGASYWGNDDRHWVWLRETGAEPRSPPSRHSLKEPAEEAVPPSETTKSLSSTPGPAPPTETIEHLPPPSNDEFSHPSSSSASPSVATSRRTVPVASDATKVPSETLPAATSPVLPQQPPAQTVPRHAASRPIATSPVPPQQPPAQTLQHHAVSHRSPPAARSLGG